MMTHGYRIARGAALGLVVWLGIVLAPIGIATGMLRAPLFILGAGMVAYGLWTDR